MSNDADDEDDQENGFRDDGLIVCRPFDTATDEGNGDPYADMIEQFRADSEELGEHIEKLISLLGKPEYKKTNTERFAVIAREISEAYEKPLGPWQLRRNRGLKSSGTEMYAKENHWRDSPKTLPETVS